MNRHFSRVIAIILVISSIVCMLSISASAEAKSSAYIFVAGANLKQGNSAGKIKVTYNITGMGLMDSIGVLCIDVYRSNGSLYSTIFGSTSNGLVRNNDIIASGTYEINCVAGQSYYCEVTLFAQKNGSGDSRTILTTTVVAPSSP